MHYNKKSSRPYITNIPNLLSSHMIIVFLLLTQMTQSSVTVCCCYVKAHTLLPNVTSLLRIPQITHATHMTKARQLSTNAYPHPLQSDHIPSPILLHNCALLELECDAITEGLTRHSVNLTPK